MRGRILRIEGLGMLSRPTSDIGTVETGEPGWLYASADELADFGALQSSLTFRVAQGGKRVPWGVARSSTCSL